MKKKTALIIGVCGQDGSILGDLLLEKGYYVVGIMKRNATRADITNKDTVPIAISFLRLIPFELSSDIGSLSLLDHPDDVIVPK